MNFRLKKTSFFSFLLFLLIPFLVKAVAIGNPLEAESVGELINTIADLLFVVALAITPIMIIVAAFHFITAGDDVEKVELAKKILLWTFVGILIIFFGRGIISLLISPPEPTPPPPPW